MYIYAEIDENGKCIGVKRLWERTEETNHIQLPQYDQNYLGQVYNPETKEWSAEVVKERK
jgi:hypothetical protein